METMLQAWRLLIGGDPDTLAAIRTSLLCSFGAVFLALLAGVPMGLVLGRRRFVGRQAVLVAVHAGMAIPTVVIGLVCYMMFSRSGWLGSLGLLYSVPAIVVGEFFLAFPIIVALLVAALEKVHPCLEMTAVTLGAGIWRTRWTVLREARIALLVAAMAAFGRVCSELGIAMMLGGNIRQYTRTMTTAIALETQKGEFAQALALGLVLLVVALVVNAVTQMFRSRHTEGAADVL